MKTNLSPSIFMVLLAFCGGCTTKIVSKQVKETDTVDGIRWVETRPYDVYVYAGTAKLKQISGPDGKAKSAGAPKLLYFGTHDLLDKVNGINVDSNRPIWEVNYDADTFSDGTLSLDFYENGVLKRAKLVGKAGTADAVRSATNVLKSPEDIAADKTSDIERETKRLKAEKDLRDARKALETK